MSTKYKIIIGFTFLVSLLIVVASVSYYSSKNSAKSLDSVQSIGGLAQMLEETGGRVNSAKASLLNFIVAPSKIHQQNVLSELDKSQELLSYASQYTQTKEILEKTEHISQRLALFKTYFEEFARQRYRFDSEYDTGFAPGIVQVAHELGDLIQVVNGSGERDTMRFAVDIWQQAGIAQREFAMFSLSYDVQSAKKLATPL